MTVFRAPKDWLSILQRHEKCNDVLLERAARICPEDLDLSTDKEVIRIRKMVNEVMTEGHMMKSFVRLKPLGDNILYGYMKPKHDIWLSVGRFFARRFPDTVILLGNNTESKAWLYDYETIKMSKAGPLAKAIEELRETLSGEIEAQTEELWEEYYWSQYCQERRNIRYYQANMPRKHLKAAGNRVEANTGRTTLDEFTE